MPSDERNLESVAAASPEQTDAVLAEAAAQYQRELVEQLGENPALDIAMFGMGPDAHFASLFPDHASRRSTIRMCLSPVCAIHRSRRHCA